MTIVEKAMRIAAMAHAGQTRKESNLPYITHPFMVALKLKSYGFSDTVLAAALVHDVLEDTDFPQEKLGAELGVEVLAFVLPVTHDNSLSWEEKKQKYIDAVRVAQDEAKAISTADKIHNVESFLAGYEKEGSDMWKHFSRDREKKVWFEEAMLQMLQETWQHPMVKEYAELVRQMKELP